MLSRFYAVAVLERVHKVLNSAYKSATVRQNDDYYEPKNRPQGFHVGICCSIVGVYH